jgi:hypothetical protein
MRRYRRLVMIDRAIPFLAALVGLVALAGAVLVQLNVDARNAAVTAAIADLRDTVEALAVQPEVAAAPPADDGSVEALLALQDRMNRLEGEWSTRQATAAPLAEPSAAAESATAAADSDLPTTDCIPLGTRFMVTPNERFALCQSSAVIETGVITDNTVAIAGAGPVVETGFSALAGTSCTVMVFSADAAGFAEVRVTCT